MASCLKFLRRTPWARQRVENLCFFMLRAQPRLNPQPQA
ncbi:MULTISPECIES: VF530 family DNA-binding protein [Giesbergeria]|uniref:VF530 family DNA-binding protein n=1 Tax=Giesbergeria sinuosa TaxID=80883 RepID=A0ABV9QE67_9BURK